jgi:hypothetical protein
MRAVPMAIFGSRPRAVTKSGEKKVAPPIPAPLAMVAMTMATGKCYQYVKSTVAYLVSAPTLLPRQ